MEVIEEEYEDRSGQTQAHPEYWVENKVLINTDNITSVRACETHRVVIGDEGDLERSFSVKVTLTCGQQLRVKAGRGGYEDFKKQLMN